MENVREKMSFEELCDNMSHNMLLGLVDECFGYNGSLEDYKVELFDEEFFEIFFSSPMEIARATYFGNISNWMDEYIRFNAYGNLESMSKWEYNSMLENNKEEIVETAVELYEQGNIYLYDEIKELFDRYIQDNEEEDEE